MSRQRWNSLPPHLMGLVIDCSDCKTIACIRLVSKAWHAAVKEHPLSPKPIRVAKTDELQRLCQILPNMSGLELSSRAGRIVLNPLSALSTLRDLSLAGRDCSWQPSQRAELCANLGGVPSSLRSLQLQFIQLCPQNVNSVKFVNLSSLSFRSRRDSNSAVWVLLQHLPQLKVKPPYLSIHLWAAAILRSPSLACWWVASMQFLMQLAWRSLTDCNLTQRGYAGAPCRRRSTIQWGLQVAIPAREILFMCYPMVSPALTSACFAVMASLAAT